LLIGFFLRFFIGFNLILSSTPAISVRQLKKRYGSLQALNGVDLTIEQGEFFGLLGPNGAGKTTLISSLAGLVRPDQGDVKIMGFDAIARRGPARVSF
jgi:ABC-2 type transport system ATP-binding protein